MFGCRADGLTALSLSWIVSVLST